MKNRCVARFTSHAHRIANARAVTALPRHLLHCFAAALMLSVVTPAWCEVGFASAKPVLRVDFWQRRQAEITLAWCRFCSVFAYRARPSLQESSAKSDHAGVIKRKHKLQLWRGFPPTIPPNAAPMLGFATQVERKSRP